MEWSRQGAEEACPMSRVELGKVAGLQCTRCTLLRSFPTKSAAVTTRKAARKVPPNCSEHGYARSPHMQILSRRGGYHPAGELSICVICSCPSSQ